MFQLDELGFAIGSPVGGAEEYNHRAFGPEQAGESAGLAILILELEAGQLAAERGAEIARVERSGVGSPGTELEFAL